VKRRLFVNGRAVAGASVEDLLGALVPEPSRVWWRHRFR
jgi:hypothetical protein